MYLDVKSKLEMYKVKTVKTSTCQTEEGLDLQDIMTGTVLQNDDGACFMLENRYPVTYLHRGYPLGKALDIDLISLHRVYSDIQGSMTIKEFLFLDTETTGLSGGVGTVAFLIGVGYFEEDVFVLRQYFMRDYDEEPAMLRELNELVARFKGLVTFNGKAFDWNLLKSRYIYNRMKLMLKNPVHIDLLYPARSIWKIKLLSCRLSSLEENILGETRVDDIPGALIPQMYFTYVEDRDASEMKRVIKHNELDILSMVSLITKIYTMVENPLEETDGEQELLGIGRIFEKSGENQRVTECYETCLKSDDFSVKETASRRLIDAYKRSRDFDRVVEQCETLLTEPKHHSLPVMIELAKHYEHRDKNIPKAIEVVEAAFVLSSRLGVKNNMYMEELRKRLERLKRKARKQSIHGKGEL